jgi:hypothetical protein
MKIIKVSQITPKENQLTCVIVRGNPKFITPQRESFYSEIKNLCERNGFQVIMDAGSPHTMPTKSDLWICHSSGCGRIRFADPTQKYIAIGTSGTKLKNVLNHPLDDLKEIPNEYHFTVPPNLELTIVKMKNIILNKLKEKGNYENI